MATAPEDPPEDLDDDILDPGEPVDQDTSNPEIDDEADPAPEGDEEEFFIDLEGDDEQPELETSPMRQMRERLKEAEKRARDAEAKIAPKPVELGPKPTLESCEWDEERFETEISNWHDQKRAVDNQQADTDRARQAADEKRRQIEGAYLVKRDTLIQRGKIDPAAFTAAETAVAQEIAGGETGDAIKALMLGYIEDPAALTYVLGNKPQRRAQIAAIEDPIKRFLAIYDLSKEIKVGTKRKSPPAPEERIQGSAPVGGSTNAKQRDKLLTDARKTGDRTKLIAFDLKQTGGK